MKWLRPGDRVITTLLLGCITLALSVTGALSRIDNVIFDAAQQHTSRDIPADVVLVTIDEQSLSTLGRWPWSRRMHAQLIERLQADGAKVIGFDVMFAEPQMDDPQADHLLATAMGRAGNVVLPVVIEEVRRNGQFIETLPLPLLAAKASALGRVHAELDADAIARSIMLWEGIGRPVWPHFAQAMLTVAGQLPAGMSSTAPQVHAYSHEAATLAKHDHRYINFATAQQHLLSLSYAQVLSGEFTPGTFNGKLVLVGATASGMADSLPTPVSGFQQPMPGVEFLANALISMRDQTLVRTMPAWLSTLLACGVAVLPMMWLPRTGTRAGLLANICFAVLVLAGVMALPVYLHVVVPLSAGLFGLLSSYPLWAWRKLESASRFLDAELSRLQQELGNVKTTERTTQINAKQTMADPFQRRIEQVRAATVQLQHLEQTQRETLAFVSHDIRVPLASAAAQIKQVLGVDHPAHKQLTRALAWTEDFLQTSRAQMLRADDFVELDLIDLLHQVADEIYPLAQAQSLQLELELPAEPVWVLGHFDTLSRAIANLLINALKFSPPSGVIGLSAKTSGNQTHIAITDQGPGIAPQDMNRLFQRFSRLDSQAQSTQTGAGLGLHFVQTTVGKHAGTVRVTSRPGQTIFVVSLSSVYLYDKLPNNNKY
jgi:CHASE2 domain-containing sensor protein/nitrogen-specific signal transduction histidine kinase